MQVTNSFILPTINPPKRPLTFLYCLDIQLDGLPSTYIWLQMQAALVDFELRWLCREKSLMLHSNAEWCAIESVILIIHDLGITLIDDLNRFSSDCLAGFGCVNGICIIDKDSCKLDRDCARGSKCINSR